MFLETVLSGEQDLVKCANKAYEASLKRYHGWLVKGIFAVSYCFGKLWAHTSGGSRILRGGCV